MKGKIIDLLCEIPKYDKNLSVNINKKQPLIKLMVTSFRYIPNYFDKKDLYLDNNFLDLVSKYQIANNFLRRSLRAVEYILNLVILSIRFSYNRPEIVHFQWLPLVPYIRIEEFFIKYLKKMNICLIYTVHNILPHDTNDFYKDNYRRIYALFDGVICHTAEAKISLIREFNIDKARINVIPHGVFAHKVENEACKKSINDLYEQYQNKKKVLMLGLVRPYKGIEFLLQSWNLVQKSDTNSLLFIVGRGEKNYVNKIKQLIANLNLEDSVVFVDRYVSDDEAAIFHQMADVLVYPYRAITQSGAILTGASFSKPVVATNLPAFNEIIKNQYNGVLVEYGDCDRLSNEIILLLNDPDRCALYGTRLQTYVENEFSWNKIADKTIDFYEKTLVNRT